MISATAQASEDFRANLFLYKFLMDKNPSAALLTSKVGNSKYKYFIGSYKEKKYQQHLKSSAVSWRIESAHIL
jgi:hypothetical protein